MMEERKRTEGRFKEEVPEEVIANIKRYFAERLPEYDAVKVCKKTGCEYLYMVAAKKVDGTYTVWTSWNERMQSLNHGHYGFSDLRMCEEVMEFYR